MKYAAIHGRAGKHEYYQLVPKVGDLKKIRWHLLPNKFIAEEIQTGQSQRAIGEIRDDISAKAGRFSGSLTFVVSPDQVRFESVSQQMGWLSLDESAILYVLDGYHRLQAISEALDRLRGSYRQEVENDDIPIVVIVSNPGKVEELFFQMRKQARVSKKGDSIRSHVYDDLAALIARRLMGGNGETGVIDQNLVNWKSNTLTNRLPKFTTLSTLHDSAKALLGKLNPNFHPNDAEIDRLYEQVAHIWRALLEGFSLFHKAISGRPSDLPILRERYLCLKASGQVAVFKAVKKAQDSQMSLERIIWGLNQISWEVTNPLWQGVMVVDSRISATVPALDLTSRLIAYLIGASFSEQEKRALLRDFQAVKKSEVQDLPLPMEGDDS